MFLPIDKPWRKKTEVFGPLAGTVPLPPESTGAFAPAGPGNPPGNSPGLAHRIISILGQAMVASVNQQIIPRPVLDWLRK